MTLKEAYQELGLADANLNFCREQLNEEYRGENEPDWLQIQEDLIEVVGSGSSVLTGMKDLIKEDYETAEDRAIDKEKEPRIEKLTETIAHLRLANSLLNVQIDELKSEKPEERDYEIIDKINDLVDKGSALELRKLYSMLGRACGRARERMELKEKEDKLIDEQAERSRAEKKQEPLAEDEAVLTLTIDPPIVGLSYTVEVVEEKLREFVLGLGFKKFHIYSSLSGNEIREG